MRTALVLALAGACGGPPEVSLPQPIEHPTYPVRARIPAGWTAESLHAPIYPADAWTLRPPTGTGTAVSLILAWQPRGGRHSAGFPGGRGDDVRPATRSIGGVARDGMSEQSDRHFMTDFDVGELAVSISAIAGTDDDRRVIDAILDAIAIDPVARPAAPSPARRALDLARRWATEHGFPTDRIVYVGQPPSDGRHAFSVFHASGLVPLRVDVASATVTRMPL